LSENRLGGFETLEVRCKEDLLQVTLNDPRRANALSPGMIAEITELYSRDLRAEGVRAVLLGGAGKHFSAGADLEHLRSRPNITNVQYLHFPALQ